MKRNHDKRFDIALSRAHKDEDTLAAILSATGAKIELKTEYRYWQKTGNICVEFESYGKPSGIASTEADHWVHSLRDPKTGDTFYMIIETRRLRALVEPYIKRGEYRKVGDNRASKCVMLPIREVLDFVLGGANEKETKKAGAATPPKKPNRQGPANPKVPPAGGQTKKG